MLDLSQFYGTEAYHKGLSAFETFKSTDGVFYVANEGKAFWLIDAIASYQPRLKKQDFQHWQLKVNDDKSCVLTCGDGNGKELIRQDIEYTTFPQDVEFYLTDGVLMLTSEY